jgi:hypothetical protein
MQYSMLNIKYYWTCVISFTIHLNELTIKSIDVLKG